MCLCLQRLLKSSRTDGDEKYYSLLTHNKTFSNLRALITTEEQHFSIDGHTGKQLHYFFFLTHYYRLFTDLLRKVGPFGQAVHVSLQDVPAHLIVERETELGMNLKMGT